MESRTTSSESIPCPLACSADNLDALLTLSLNAAATILHANRSPVPTMLS